MADRIDSEVRSFVASALGVADTQLRDESSLFHDFGVDGDDAQEFLVGFSRRFEIDMSTFRFSDYFGPEASINPLSLVPLLVKGQRSPVKERVTFSDLVRAAKNRKW